MKHITIHECFDKIYIRDDSGTDTITTSQARELDIFVRNFKLDQDNIVWGRDYVSFVNYVGFMKLPSFSIEILPKVNVSQEKDDDSSRKVLLNMLSKTGSLDIKHSELSLHKIFNKSLFEIFAHVFAVKLEAELVKGIHLQYIQKDENLSFMKGKLLINDHIQNRAKNSCKAYCRFEEFESINLLNQIFKCAIDLLIPKIKSIETVNKLKYCASFYADLDRNPINNCDLDTFQFNRMNKRFEPAFHLAKMFLKSYSASSALSDQKSFSFLFRMDELFEKYVAHLIKRNVEQLVSVQDNRYKLLVNELSANKSFPIKPDIVIEHNGIERLIIDTKWKRANGAFHRHGLKREDLYQMYAYLTRYEKSTCAILLYPHNEDVSLDAGESLESWFLENHLDKKLKLYTIDLSNEVVAIEMLKNMINHNILESN